MERVQSHDKDGWICREALKGFMDWGMLDFENFVDGVSGILNRGCNDQPCRTGEVHHGKERRGKLEMEMVFMDRPGAKELVHVLERFFSDREEVMKKILVS